MYQAPICRAAFNTGNSGVAAVATARRGVARGGRAPSLTTPMCGTLRLDSASRHQVARCLCGEREREGVHCKRQLQRKQKKKHSNTAHAQQHTGLAVRPTTPRKVGVRMLVMVLDRALTQHKPGREVTEVGMMGGTFLELALPALRHEPDVCFLLTGLAHMATLLPAPRRTVSEFVEGPDFALRTRGMELIWRAPADVAERKALAPMTSTDRR